MRVIKVKSRIRDYEVVFGRFDLFLNEIGKGGKDSVFYVIDEKVWGLYKNSRFKRLDACQVKLVKADEFKKTLKTVMDLYDALIERSAKKNIVLVSVGGGIIQDVSGFLASTMYRGIKWIYAPTTLLAQADSCIGGKTSLNYKSYKNLVGTFYPPHRVIVDSSFIDTQENLDFYSGVGEIVKLHLMWKEKYLNAILKFLPEAARRNKKAILKAICNSLLVKKAYIEDDEFDQGKRNLLNYGHCFGHALEKVSSFEIPHGQAVVAGMMLANIVSRARGLLSCRLEDRLFRELLLPVLFVKPKRYLLKPQDIIAAMKKDKKRVGRKLPLIIMKEGINPDKINDLEEKEVRLALRELSGRI